MTGPSRSSRTPAWLEAARSHWQWRGERRPAFAVSPEADQVSVWGFPRPPRIVPDSRVVVVRWGDIEIARTERAQCVLETSHPPSFYLPWSDVDRGYFEAAGGGSFCEWKGPASYWSLVDGARALRRVGWSYPQPLDGAQSLANCVALYPAELDCTVGGARVWAQPGGFYGGWITPELVGPFKGEPGSESW